MNFEKDATITSAGNMTVVPPPIEIPGAGNQVALDLVARVVDDPVGRVGRGVVRPDRRDVLPEP